MRYDGSGVETEFLCLPTAIERVCYDLLEFSYPGWENGEGAYGTFTFNVAARSINLVHDERYTASETFEHDF